MIPKILHQTWKNNELSPFFAELQTRLRSLHPDWEYRLWTDEDNRALVAQSYPDMLSLYDALPKNVMRADVIRYLILDNVGGVYCDLDYEVVRPLDEMVQTCDLLLPLSREKRLGHPEDTLGNCVLGSVPNHLFWQDVITDLKTNPPLTIKQQHEVEMGTGPAFLTRVYFASPEKYAANTPPREQFHPPSDLADDPNYHDALRSLGSYGLHHCSGTWRTFGNSRMSRLMAKLKKRVKALVK